MRIAIVLLASILFGQSCVAQKLVDPDKVASEYRPQLKSDEPNN
jgi:hypothetical protein